MHQITLLGLQRHALLELGPPETFNFIPVVMLALEEADCCVYIEGAAAIHP
jgi:hypothetical protein